MGTVTSDRENASPGKDRGAGWRHLFNDLRRSKKSRTDRASETQSRSKPFAAAGRAMGRYGAKLAYKIRNLPLRASFVLYVVFFLIVALAVSSATVDRASTLRQDIYARYSVEEEKKILYNGQETYAMTYFSPSNVEELFTPQERILYKLYDAIVILALPFWFSLCIFSAAMLFYRNKLKQPIRLLKEATVKIAENDLDFRLCYDRQDEMGRLCASFEKMRGALQQTTYDLWRQMEERKRLNAAFSHDLRTPLTVLKGYADMLSSYLPNGVISQQKAVETVDTMSQQIQRLENYVAAMNRLQKLENLELHREAADLAALTGQLQDTASILCAQKALEFHIEPAALEKEASLLLDVEAVLQVYENLLANALRFAEKQIWVTVLWGRERLSIAVEDDGPGFSREQLEKATAPFYTSQDRPDPRQIHFGLGLYICKILCQKHQGELLLDNTAKGGRVLASFSGSSGSSGNAATPVEG